MPPLMLMSLSTEWRMHLAFGIAQTAELMNYNGVGIYQAVLTVYLLKMGECREVLGGGPAPPSKL